MIARWMQTVIDRCAAKGQLTSKEIQSVAWAAGHQRIGHDLVGALKKCRFVRVEVVGEQPNARSHGMIKFYRVTLREGKAVAAGQNSHP